MFPANLGHQQSQFRFDNECNISLPDNHKRVSEAPALDFKNPLPDPGSLLPYNPEDPRCPIFADPRGVQTPETSHNPERPEISKDQTQTPVSLEPEDRGPEDPQRGAACVVVKDDWTPRGLRLADEARQVAAAHASMLVDVEACKRVSMACLR